MLILPPLGFFFGTCPCCASPGGNTGPCFTCGGNLTPRTMNVTLAGISGARKSNGVLPTCTTCTSMNGTFVHNLGAQFGPFPNPPGWYGYCYWNFGAVGCGNAGLLRNWVFFSGAAYTQQWVFTLQQGVAFNQEINFALPATPIAYPGGLPDCCAVSALVLPFHSVVNDVFPDCNAESATATITSGTCV